MAKTSQSPKYMPTISLRRVERLAAAQGLRVHRSRYRSTVRWVLTRGDWADYKEYLIYPTLRDTYAALQPKVRDQ